MVFENVIAAGVSVLALALTVIGALAYRRTRERSLVVLTAAFAVFFVKGIALTFNRDLADSPELRQSLLTERNSNWAKWIEQRLAQPGTIMLAVGAGHLAGKDSVLEMLRRDGVQVRRLQ